MADRIFHRPESRTSPRFVPKDPLSVFLANRREALVQGDVKDLSETGACVLTNAALDGGGPVTVDVRSGYSFLFRAQARIVWRSDASRSLDFDCVHGLLFTDLSSFARKLIRRLGGFGDGRETSPQHAVPSQRDWGVDADSDPDLEILMGEGGSREKASEDFLEVLTDASFAKLIAPPSYRAPDRRKDAPERRLETIRASDLSFSGLEIREDDIWTASSDPAVEPLKAHGGSAELSGNLGYFHSTEVLQLLEAAGATGILAIEGEYSGEVHLHSGRICGCFSPTLSKKEATFRLLIAARGRFRFTPGPVRENLRRRRTTTELLLEAQLRRDEER